MPSARSPRFRGDSARPRRMSVLEVVTLTSRRDQRSHREPLMKTSAVALRCGVTSETVIEWAKAGKLSAKRTPGGQYRFDPAEVDALMESEVAQ